MLRSPVFQGNRCPGCGDKDRGEGTACTACGAPRTVGCLACGIENPASNRYCGQCGRPVRAEAPTSPSTDAGAPIRTIVPERRQVTTMIIETRAAWAGPATRDGAGESELVEAGRNLVRDAVRPFGGYAGHETGDASLLRFEFRRARDNDVRRAVEAALAVVDRAVAGRGDLVSRWGAAVDVRIGIHTTVVSPGVIDGTRTRSRRDGSDGTTAVAVRLRDLAEPNSIVICGLTARLAGALAGLVPLGATHIAGIDRTFDLFWLGPAPSFDGCPDDAPVPIEDLRLLQVAAVIGRRFSVEDLAALTDRPAEAVATDLDVLAGMGLVDAGGGRGTFRFRGDRLRDAAYEALPLGTRRDLHALYATRLATRPASVGNGSDVDGGPAVENGPDTIGYHWARAHDPERACRSFREAGAGAIARGALAEAMRHFDDALDQAHLLHDAGEIQAAKFAVELERGRLFLQLKGYASPEAEQCFARTAELAPAVADDRDLFASFWGQGSVLLARGSFGRGVDMCRQMVDLAALTGDGLLRGEAFRLSALARFLQGDVRAAEMHFARAFESFHRLDPGVPLYGTRPAILARVGRAWLMWFLGRPNLALDEIRLAEQQARAVGDPHARVCAFAIEASLGHLRQDPAMAAMAGETCARIGHENGFPYWAAWGDIVAGWAAAIEGDEGGIDRMRDGWGRYRATGAAQLDLYARTLLADGLRRHDGAEEALEILDFDRVGSDTAAAPYALVEAYLTRGRIHAGLGRQAELATDLSAAVATARRQGSIMLERRAVLHLRHLRRPRTMKNDSVDLDLMLVELSRP